jgi:hypothetical protein
MHAVVGSVGSTHYQELTQPVVILEWCGLCACGMLFTGNWGHWQLGAGVTAKQLRLNVFPDVATAMIRPSYSSLHPLYMEPGPLCIQAVLKALPTVLIQAAVGGSTFSGLVRAALTTGFALATHEAGDFKSRQVVAMVPMSSPSFVLMMLFRSAEVLGQLLAMQMGLAVWTLLLFDPLMLGLLAQSAHKRGRNPPIWVMLSWPFLFLDHRAPNGMLVLSPKRYYAIRGLEHLAVAARGAWQLSTTAGYTDSVTSHTELLALCGLTVFQLLAFSSVRERFWKPPPDRVLRGTCSEIRSPLRQHRASNSAHVKTPHHIGGSRSAAFPPVGFSGELRSRMGNKSGLTPAPKQRPTRPTVGSELKMRFANKKALLVPVGRRAPWPALQKARLSGEIRDRISLLTPATTEQPRVSGRRHNSHNDTFASELQSRFAKRAAAAEVAAKSSLEDE